MISHIGSAIQKTSTNQSSFHCGMLIIVSHCHETGGTIVVFTEILILVSHKVHHLFLKFPVPHNRLDEACHLARSRVVTVNKYTQYIVALTTLFE